MEKRPLLIDCDPGVDDAQALMMLAASDLFEVRGITTVDGNVPLELTTKNALFLSEFFGLDCPVAAGADRGLLYTMPSAPDIHGTNGLGEYEVSPINRRVDPRPAWELIYETAKESRGRLEILALGPLTNLAIAVLEHPDLIDYVRKVTFMGGASKNGNVTPMAEFNAWKDPHAVEVVLEAGFRRLVMVDNEACKTAYMTDEEADCVNEMDSPVAAFLQHLRSFTKRTRQTARQTDPIFRNVIYDAVAAAVAMDPSIAVTEPYYVLCESQSAAAYGQTVVDWTCRFNISPNVELVLSVDRKEFIKTYYQCCSRYMAGEDQ